MIMKQRCFKKIRYLLLSTFIAGSVPFICNAAIVPADFSITDSVVNNDVEPLGALIGGLTGGTNFTSNNFIHGSGFEPAYTRYLIRVDSAGPGWFKFNQDGGNSFWEQCTTGYGNGAALKIYRIVNSSGQPLTWSGGLNNEIGADHVIKLGQTKVSMPSTSLPGGGWIVGGTLGGRIYYDDQSISLAHGDYVYINIRMLELEKKVVHPRLLQYLKNGNQILGKPDAWNAKLAPHPAPVPQQLINEDGGESCYELEATSTEKTTLGQYIFHRADSSEGNYYSTMPLNCKFRVEAWLRQEGLGNGGKVRFASSGIYANVDQKTPWAVTGTWTKYTYDFTSPSTYPDNDQWHHVLGLEVTGPGKLWVDNFVVYQYDSIHEFRPFSPCTTAYNEFLRSIPAFGKKPVLRFYGSTYPTMGPINSLFSQYGTSSLDFIYNIKPSSTIMTMPQALYWAYKSGNTPDNRIIPYFTLTEEYTEEDWKAIVEYLGIPYNPTIDSPQSKPYAYKRYLQRGNGTPWTDEFREIQIEYGNEGWHNGAGGYGWHGFGGPSYVWDGGLELGLFARYMLDQNVAKMPEWNSLNLKKKIKFMLNGDYMVGIDAYGEIAAQQCTTISYITHASYVGPKWETDDQTNKTFDDNGIRRTLLGARPEWKQGYLGQHAKFRDQLRASGKANYDLQIYEGGPSGYVFQGDMSFQKIAERYGKTLAMGLASIDEFMYGTYVGYKGQCYSGYGCGSGWSSHTMPAQGGFRPHSGWLTLQLRNKFMAGNVMTYVRPNAEPNFSDKTFSDSIIPLTSVYCLSNKEKSIYSVLILNRKLAGVQGASNFGDGYTPVTLRLPFTKTPQKISVHRIAHPDGSIADARETNIESLMLSIVSSNVPVSNFSPNYILNETTGATSKGIPPAGVYLYVFDLDTALTRHTNVINPFKSRNARNVNKSVIGTRSAVSHTNTTASIAFRSEPSVSEITADAASGKQPVPVYMESTAPLLSASLDRNLLRQPLASKIESPLPSAVQKLKRDVKVERNSRVKSLPVLLTLASSSKKPNVALRAVDGDERTRWMPSAKGRQWYSCTFDKQIQASQFTIDWYMPVKSSVVFTVLCDDGSGHFEPVFTGTSEGKGAIKSLCSFSPRMISAIKVMIEPIKGEWVPSICEIRTVEPEMPVSFKN